MKHMNKSPFLSDLFSLILLLSSPCDGFLLLPSWKFPSLSSSPPAAASGSSSILQVQSPPPISFIINHQRLKNEARKSSSSLFESSTTGETGVIQRDEQMTVDDDDDDDNDDDSSLTKSQKRRKKRRNRYSPKERVDRLDWVVVEEYRIPKDGIDFSTMSLVDDSLLERFERLEITPKNMTVAVALHLLDPERFPTLSKARKACRQGKIALVIQNNDDGDDGSINDAVSGGIKDLGEDPQRQQLPQRRRALVSDRVGPFDKLHRKETRSMLTRQQNLSEDNTPGGSQSTMSTKNTTTSNDQYDVCSLVAPYFQLQVVYEDDYMAIVNKPAGVLVHPESGKGRNNILYALPYVLRKPSHARICGDHNDDDDEVLDHPVPVHRLDFVTSGLLVVGKTKNSVRRLSQQFEYRKAHKTYTAMVWGVPSQNKVEEEERIPPALLHGDENSDAKDWNLAESAMDGKKCRTWWRIIKTYQYYLHVDDDQTLDNTTAEPVLDQQPFSPPILRVPISLVELKPETGRYHQLRRQMAWLYNTPMCGDPIYVNSTSSLGYDDDKSSDSDSDGNNIVSAASETVAAAISLSGNLRYHRGLMLCSNRIRLEHPFYNTPIGRIEWNNRKDEVGGQRIASTEEKINSKTSSSLYETSFTATGITSLTEEDEEDDLTNKRNIVVVDACIPVPKKFDKFQQLLQRMSNRGEGEEEGL